MSKLFLFFMCVISILSCANPEKKQTSSQKVKIIFDTDLGAVVGDIDDMGALALTHGLINQGKCELLAVMSCLSSNDALRLIDVVNTYFGRGDIPIGHTDGETHEPDTSFAHYIAQRFPHDVKPEEVPNATALYRKILSGHPDTSVIIVTVGHIRNIYNLLKSGPDSVSELTGMELVEQKVKKFHMMGGSFPGPNPHPVNFKHSGECVSKFAIENCPRPIYFNGTDIGNMQQGFVTGSGLNRLPDDSPVKACFKYWFKHPVSWYWQEPCDSIRDHHHWDQIAVLTAVEGVNDWFGLVTEGHCTLDCEGSTLWKTDLDKDHNYMTIKMDPKEFSNTYIQPLMMSLPEK